MNWVAFFHRWMGVILAPFFVMWFLSGIVMIYVPFPSVTTLERLKYMSEIELDRIAIEPTAALEACGSKEVFQLAEKEEIPIIIITNQSGISQKFSTWDDYEKVTMKMLELLDGIKSLAAIYANSQSKDETQLMLS